jgi:hypothetical protein
MSTGASEQPSPEPSPALLAAVRGMRPVATRRPERQLMQVIAISLVYTAAWVAGPAAWIWGRSLRVDLAALPRAWLFAFGALWLFAFAAPLAIAMLPRRGQLLHRVRTAAVASWVAWIALATAALAAQVAPGASAMTASRAQFLSVTAQCAAAALSVALVPATLALRALRRAIPIGGAGVAAAIGAAGGALGGLALHVHCPWAEPAHVLLGHAAPVGIAAGVAALVGARLLPP